MITWCCDREGCPTKIKVASGSMLCLPITAITLIRESGKYEFCSDFCLELFTHPKLMEQAKAMAVFHDAS